ncbi:hypothetical protein DVH05_015137 [Phytophthora capsici]|nr:hypothetical protein DVH05_015137 [Phytophthora capsici]
MLQLLVPGENSLLSSDALLDVTDPSFTVDTALPTLDELDPCDLFNLYDMSTVSNASTTPLPDLGAEDVTLETLNELLVEDGYAALPETLDCAWVLPTSPASASPRVGPGGTPSISDELPQPDLQFEMSSTTHTLNSSSDVLLIDRAITADANPAEVNDSEPDVYDADLLLAASASVLKRPKLPKPPAHHPSAHWHNHFDPDAPVDTEALYNVKKLLDRFGKPPHVAYLVEWDMSPCQLSWEWPENLTHVDYLMNQVNAWKRSGASCSFTEYYRKHFRGAKASDTGSCFLETIRSICHDLGQSNLVTEDLWATFCAEYKKDLTNGVVRCDIAEFFEFLQRNRIGLDYSLLRTNAIDQSLTSIQILGHYAQRSLSPGRYLVHAAHDLVEHCFALVVTKRGRRKTLEVIDGFDAAYDPPCYREPLAILDWLTKVVGVYRVELKQFEAKKRKSKTARKRAKRARNR